MEEIILGIVIKRAPVKDKDVRVTLMTPAGLKRFNIMGVNRAQLFSVSEFTIASHKIIKEHVIQSNFEITKNYDNYVRACKICQHLLDTVPLAGEHDTFPIAMDEFKQTIEKFEGLACPTK